MKITCLGAGHEVGRNSFLIESNRQRIAFDAGLHVEDGELPMIPKGPVDACFITHGHLDHLGSAPVLHKRTRARMHMTAPTVDFSDLLLHDSLKVARIKERDPHYHPADILKMMKDITKVKYGEEVKPAPGCKMEVWDAGHIPGSAMFLLTMDGKKILYTGDFKLEPTKLISGAKAHAANVDLMIMENTYSTRDQPERKDEEKRLWETIQATIETGGKVLMPTFASRAPEILMILEQYGADVPIYLDGMAKAATEIALKYPEYIRDYKKLKDAISMAIPLYENEERNNAMKEPCIIVTTGGAMEGGPIVHYMKNMYSDGKSAIMFTGYQIPKTAGRYMLDTNRYIVGALDFKVKMKIHSFSFSSHADRTELIKFIQKVRPNKIAAIHGDYCDKFATEMKGRFGIEAVAPKNGDTIKI
ncbi:MAG: MBL fold metallo-hydrolase RNA specificity domain-containing protein [Nanoarchaeota archaeon]